MTLTNGTRIGSYEVEVRLGAGGMGEVYRATDTKLGRAVALKVLPDCFAGEPERMRRLQREAKLLASLNHPNIAAIYGFEDSSGVHVLVMELVEGLTLADRLLKSALSHEEALPLAKQICQALEYAHERGIVHRDLKPTNVKITPEGTVKLLDFGLATMLESDTAPRDIASSPTITRMMTREGIILGTAAYMSPEQAKGKAADRRSDIWSFGCVFYEMLTGKMAFGGETVTDTLASVIKSEPDWSVLAPSMPLAIRKLLQRCLKKDSKQRLQAIGEARIAIEEAISGSDTDAFVPSASAARPSRRRLLPWVAAFASGAVLMGVLFLTFAFRNTRSPAMHFRTVTNFSGVQSYPALSPDGRSVAFVSNKDGPYNIYVGLINGGNPVKLTDDSNLKIRPCWSPDGTEIAYARLNDSGIWDIWKVPALGGVPRRFILNAADPTWSRDGRSFAYRHSVTGAIWISDSFGQNGHELAAARKPGATTGFVNSAPRFSPDGREVAFGSSWGGPYGELEVVNLDSGKVRQLTHDNALVLSPAWSADGRFIYFASSRGGTLNIWKIAENGSQLEQITSGQGDDAQLDISADGKRIIFSTFRTNVNIVQLDLDAAGQQSAKLLIADAARDQFGPAYSPDGKHLAYFSNFKGVEREGIWLANPDGSNPVPLVQDQRINIFPRWTRDSKYLVYASYSASSLEGSPSSEYRRISISGGTPQTLRNSALLNSAPDNTADVGSDGQLLFQGSYGQVQTFISQSTQTLMTVPSNENASLFRWSPDDHSIAYLVGPAQEDDLNAGLWVYDRNKQARQLFHGWINWYARGPKDQIYFIQGKADMKGVLWKADWSGHSLTRVPLNIPLPFHYWFDAPFTQFDISPDGRHLAFNTQEVLQANIGMLENVP
ncbi:MAG TPA: protein kinase [Terriglobales bacterium]|nr:protein kinase [Terriglobales bacterium]